ncbi:MAG: ATP-binding protein [Bryobacteraceae bacterium]|nr:ATP-binding protein [Bryobacteraceae bacterium]MDW8376591.1 ATP-binding protein [Bryobacterales bacterium]
MEKAARQLRPVLWIAFLVALTSAGHYLTPPAYRLWHSLFQRLYYLPVVYAAISFGWRGGLVTAAFSGACYLPHILTTWSDQHHYARDQYAEIFMFFAVGLVTGVLSDRERAQRAELKRVYEELQSSFEQVKRADRLSSLGQLAAGLAHEIRNPLSSIDGAAEVLQTGTDSEDVRQETLTIIRRECARLFRLLTDLLDFARPRQPELGVVNLENVLEKVINLVGHSAGREIRFVKETSPQLPAILGDEEQLAQVFLNLSINAVQAMPEGGEIRLQARRCDHGVVVEVLDQGVGVPEEHLDRIFDPFFTTKDTGTGLGLSVVHQIVTQHGGTVSAQRNPDRGMTFRVFLPSKPLPETREKG